MKLNNKALTLNICFFQVRDLLFDIFDLKVDGNLEPSSGQYVLSVEILNSFLKLHFDLEWMIGSLERFKRTKRNTYKNEIDKALRKVIIVFIFLM